MIRDLRVQPQVYKKYVIRVMCPGAITCPEGHCAEVAALPSRLTPEGRRFRYYGTPDPDYAGREEVKIVKKSSISLGAFYHNNLVALVHLTQREVEIGELSFQTDPDHAGNGLARTLAKKLLLAAWQMGYARVLVHTMIENKAMAAAVSKIAGARVVRRRDEDEGWIVEIYFDRPAGHTTWLKIFVGGIITLQDWAFLPTKIFLDQRRQS